jgi:hypothetical protein
MVGKRLGSIITASWFIYIRYKKYPQPIGKLIE